MPMYNLIEYSKNYSETSGNLWQCYRVHRLYGNMTILLFPVNYDTSLSMKFQKNMTGRTGNDSTEDVEIWLPIKYMSSFWNS